MKLDVLSKTSDNNFDFLRFIAATLVIFSHSYPLIGAGSVEPLFKFNNFESLGGVAVSTFFIISGFLITKSWHNSPDIGIFYKKRMLRVYPGLICAVLFGLFFIGPLVTSVSLHDYFFDSSAYKYLRNIFLFRIKDDLPGVFADNPLKGAVNGSLWTLPCEIFLYIIIAFLGWLQLFRKKFVLPFMTIIAWLLYQYVYKGSTDVTQFLWFPGKQFMKLAAFFFMGSSFFLYKKRITVSLSIFILSLITYGVGITIGSLLVCFLSLPYVVLYLAYAPLPFVNRWGKYGDVSYGMYIYAFPIQQTLMHYGRGRLTIPTFFLLSAALTFIAAALSWHVIEKQALKKKHFLTKGIPCNREICEV